jgi:5-methylcytosine-specific restriction endonuclease McrA
MSNWKDWPSQSPEARAKRRAANREKIAAQQRAWAAAHPEYQKNWDKANADWHKAWWAVHPEQRKAASRKSSTRRRVEKPEEVAAYRAEWLERPGIREKRRVYESLRGKALRLKAAAEREKIPVGPLSDHPRAVKNREYQRAWRQKNPDKVRELKRVSNQNRRAKEKAAGRFTPAEWREVCARQNGLCFDCGERRRLTVGHLVPLSKGGHNVITNIVAQCMACNHKQGTAIHPSVRG